MDVAYKGRHAGIVEDGSGGKFGPKQAVQRILQLYRAQRVQPSIHQRLIVAYVSAKQASNNRRDLRRHKGALLGR
jgi:hypothetical protein